MTIGEIFLFIGNMKTLTPPNILYQPIELPSGYENNTNILLKLNIDILLIERRLKAEAMLLFMDRYKDMSNLFSFIGTVETLKTLTPNKIYKHGTSYELQYKQTKTYLKCLRFSILDMKCVKCVCTSCKQILRGAAIDGNFCPACGVKLAGVAVYDYTSYNHNVT
jgi:hypothetical protein